jgi:hypothetical protein
VNVGRSVFDNASGARSANSGKAPPSEERRERRERDSALKEASDQIPMPLKLIVAALMGASRG